MKWSVLGAGAMVALGGCGAPPLERSPYEVGSVGGVLFSNSLAALHDVRPRPTPRGFELVYPLLFQNQSRETAQLGLAEASLTGNLLSALVMFGIGG